MRVESGRKAAAALKDGVKDWTRWHAEVVALVESGRFHDAQQLSLTKGRPIVEANEHAAETIATNQARFLEEDMAASDQAYVQAGWSMLGVGGVASGVVLLMVWVVLGINAALRQTAAELQIGAEQVTAASGQVSASAQSLSQGATEQAAALEETSASMEEMSSLTRRNAEHTRHAASLATSMATQMEQSNVALHQMVQSMADIRNSSDQSPRSSRPSTRSRFRRTSSRSMPRSKPRGRGGHGLRRRSRRSAEPRASIGTGRARYDQPHRRIDRTVA
jgi:methyl-accepting chemotaxis protein